MTRRGNCYVTSEALFHLLGGRKAGWTPMRVACTHLKNGVRSTTTETHWFLKHSSGLILDATAAQFRARGWWRKPNYARAKGTGFLTKRPSVRARLLMRKLVWQYE